MKQYGIVEGRMHLEEMKNRDIMEESMWNALAYLESQHVKGEVMPEYGRIELKFGGGNYPLAMKIEFDSDREVATASIVMPVTCIKEKRELVSELLHRINFVTVLGEWKLDPNDGECLMKYTHYIGDTAMSMKQCERMIDITLLSAHRYEDTLIPLMMGKEPNMADACEAYTEMMATESRTSSFREMVLNAIEARKMQVEEDIITDSEAEVTDDDSKMD